MALRRAWPAVFHERKRARDRHSRGLILIPQVSLRDTRFELDGGAADVAMVRRSTAFHGVVECCGGTPRGCLDLRARTVVFRRRFDGNWPGQSMSWHAL